MRRESVTILEASAFSLCTSASTSARSSYITSINFILKPNISKAKEFLGNL